MLLYRDISSGGNSTAGCVFGCLDELASSELSGLFLLLLAMLTTVVLEAESSVVFRVRHLTIWIGQRGCGTGPHALKIRKPSNFTLQIMAYVSITSAKKDTLNNVKFCI